MILRTALISDPPEASIDLIPESAGAASSRTTTSDAASSCTLSVDVDSKLEQFPEHLLGIDTIQKGALLARGGMAKIFNGKYGVIPVALKQAVRLLDALLNEAATIMKLKHPNVVQVYGMWKDRRQRVFMVVSIIVICGFY